MPTGFNWEEITKPYLKEVKRIVRNSPDLKAILAKGWKYEPWLFELLSDRALNDPFIRENDLQLN